MLSVDLSLTKDTAYRLGSRKWIVRIIDSNKVGRIERDWYRSTANRYWTRSSFSVIACRES